MYPAFIKNLLQRGAVFNLFNVNFPNKSKSKYCVVMENYYKGANNLVVVFTTHRVKYASQPTAVRVNNGLIKGINGDTLIQCDNFREIPTGVFFDRQKSAYLDNLSQPIMSQVDQALTHIININQDILVRMTGP